MQIDKFALGIQNESGQRLTEFSQENTLVIANTLFQQHKKHPYTWTSPDGWYQNQIDYILCSWRWRSSIQSAKTRPGAAYGSDHQPLYCKQVKLLSRVRLFATPWTVAQQPLPSMEFSRQEYWSGLPFPSPGDLLDPGIEPGLRHCRQTLCRLSHQGIW